MKEEGSPFNIVEERIFEKTRVTNIAINIMNPKIAADKSPDDMAKKIVIIVISIGNLPLQGIKLFVKIAISLSLGESIILHPTTPAALHPKPIHIVRACLPQAEHFLKHLSRLKAIRGRNPISSRIVKRGKNIAIGGSITATTQPVTLIIPSQMMLFKIGSSLMLVRKAKTCSSKKLKNLERSADG